MYLNDLIACVSKMLNMNVEMGEQCLYFVLILWLTVGFNEVNRRLREVVHVEKNELQINAIRKINQTCLRLRTLTNKFNDCFGLLVQEKARCFRHCLDVSGTPVDGISTR